MATDPKIRYDIAAQATGFESVARLATELEKLDGSIDPELAERARSTAAQLRLLGEQQAAIDKFVTLKAKTGEAAQSLQTAQAAAQQYGRELAGLEQPTAAQTGRMAKLRDEVRSAKEAHVQSVSALQSQRGALAAAGIDTTELASAQQRLGRESQQTATFGRSIGDAYRQQATEAEASGQRQTSVHRQIGTGVRSISTQLEQLRKAATLALGAQASLGLAADIAKTADEYKNLRSQIRLVTGEGAALDQAMQGVIDVAVRTNGTLADTGMLFTRIAEAGKSVGVSTAAALRLTETVNQAVQIGGASADASRAAVTQLIQGLQSGVLRGDEFNSVMEQAPRLAKALADGLGVTTGELRKMAEQGQLTSERVISALQGQSDAVAAEFGKLEPTVGRALQTLQTRWTTYVGEVDQAHGISKIAAAAIMGLANHLDQVAATLFSVGKAVAAYKALRLAQVFIAETIAARDAAGAKTAETASLVTNTVKTVENTAAKTSNAAQTVAAARASDVAAAARGRETTATAANTAAWVRGGTGVADAGAKAGAASTLFRGLAGAVASLVPQLKLLALISVVTNLDEIGTALGEGVAKWMGYGKQLDQNMMKVRAMDQALAEQSQAHEAHRRKLQEAADAALGLNKQSKGLVDQFDKLRADGETAAEAIGKLAEKFRLVDPQGIRDAATALDALAVHGKASADQVRDALAKALDGQDLGKFEATARAAFDGSEQGARRLQMTIDAMDQESLRRAGTSVMELRTGFSEATNSAINDVDALAGTIVKLGLQSDASGAALARSLDKALEAANTEKAVRAVMERYEDLGKQGLITGDQMTEGLKKAQTKVDDLKPGINSLQEAARKAGVDFDLLTTGVSKGFRDSVQQVRDLADQLRKSGVAAEAAAPQLQRAFDQRVAAASTKQELQLVIAEGERLVRTGQAVGPAWKRSLDDAKQKLQELTPEMEKARAAAKRLGIDLEADVKKGAEGGVGGAIKAYEDLVHGAKSTRKDVSNAFDKMAREVIESNAGIVPEWLKVEAQIRGSVIEIDDTGNALTRMARKGEYAGQVVTGAGSAMQTAFEGVGNSIDEATRKLDVFSNAGLAARNAAVKSVLDDTDRLIAKDAKGNPIEIATASYLSVLNQLKGYGLGDSDANAIAREFTDGSGKVNPLNNPGRRKYAPEGGSLDYAVQKAAERWIYEHGGSAKPGTPIPAPSPSPVPAPSIPGHTDTGTSPVGGTRTVNVLICGQHAATITVASQRDSDALAALLKRLETAKAVAA